MSETKTQSISILKTIKYYASKYPYFFSISLMLISFIFLLKSIKGLYPPPEVVTKYKMQGVEKIIRSHHNNKTNIFNLNNFPEFKDKTLLLDGWNNKIICLKLSKLQYKLISYGEDGIKGNKPDIFYTFNL